MGLKKFPRISPGIESVISRQDDGFDRQVHALGKCGRSGQEVDPVTTDVPFEIAQVWWETGQAAVTLHFRHALEFSVGAQWLYLGFIFAPEDFREDAGYLGQFLVSAGHPRLATFTALRRMVGDGRAQAGRDWQQYRDAFLAVTRSPNPLALPVARFAFTFLLERARGGTVPVDRSFARQLTVGIWNQLESKGGLDLTSDLANQVAQMRDELLTFLE